MTAGITEHRGAHTTASLLEAALAPAPVDLVESSIADVVIVLEATDHSSSLVAGLDADVRLVLSADDPDVASLATATPAIVRTVGLSPSADVTVDAISASSLGTDFTLTWGDERVAVHLGLIGERHALPAAAAIVAAVELGADLAAAATAVAGVTTSEPGNMEVVHLEGVPAGVLVIDDGYDLGAASTVEALKTIAEITAEFTPGSLTAGRRSVVVLGELSGFAPGEALEARDEHDRIGRLVVRLNIGKLICVGAGSRHLHTAAGLEGSWDGESQLTQTANEAYDLLRADFREGDVVLVKLAAGNGTNALGTRLGELLGGALA